jgi:hypothetical protein
MIPLLELALEAHGGLTPNGEKSPPKRAFQGGSVNRLAFRAKLAYWNKRESRLGYTPGKVLHF